MAISDRRIDIGSLPGYRRLKEVGAMGRLLVAVLRTAVKRPYSWRAECMSEAALAFRRAWLPAVLGMVLIASGGAIAWFSPMVESLGTADRVATGASKAWMREEALWITMMVVAGVAGSAMTADLGARRIRGEIDAMSVLAVGVVRSVVVPRVIALALISPVLCILGVMAGDITMYALYPAFIDHNVTVRGYIENQMLIRWPVDLFFLSLKASLIGVLMGIVYCHKGITASGGTEGVGRAVNEAVLITIVAVFVIGDIGNLLFYNALFPDYDLLRG
jgi:phospholipid/cholesterol/gamma-HCH transport system permease protein